MTTGKMHDKIRITWKSVKVKMGSQIKTDYHVLKKGFYIHLYIQKKSRLDF